MGGERAHPQPQVLLGKNEEKVRNFKVCPSVDTKLETDWPACFQLVSTLGDLQFYMEKTLHCDAAPPFAPKSCVPTCNRYGFRFTLLTRVPLSDVPLLTDRCL